MHWLKRAVNLLHHKATDCKCFWGSGGFPEALCSRTWPVGSTFRLTHLTDNLPSSSAKLGIWAYVIH
eukprot:1147632-Pelagomonas_calceolata.AAC.1